MSASALALAQMIDALPGDMRLRVIVHPGEGPYTVDELRQALTQAHPRVLTTGQAAEIFGWSEDSWRRWAVAGDIEGAAQDDEGGRWRLPFAACEDHYRRRMSGRTKGGGKRRGRPWKKTAPTPSARAGAEDLSGPGIAVVQGGPAAVGRRQADDAQPARSGMAGAGGTHRESGDR